MRIAAWMVVVVGCSGQTGPAKESGSIAVAWPVTWTRLVNSAVDADVLVKSGGEAQEADAGAVSQQTLSGDGWFAFTVDAVDAFRFVGLSRQPGAAGDAQSIDFAFRLQSGRADIYENGFWRADNTVVVGDVLKITRQSGAIQYAKNGISVYSSAWSIGAPLTADAALIDVDASVAHARITAPLTQPPFEDPPPSEVDPVPSPSMAPAPEPTPTPTPTPVPMVARHRFCGWTLATGYVTPDQDPGYTTFAAHADDFDAIHPAW